MRILSLILFLSCCGFTIAEDSDFLEKVVGETHHRHDYYLSVRMCRDSDTVRYVVENHFMFTYMQTQEKAVLPYGQYRAAMLETLQENKVIPVKVAFSDLQSKWRFMKVQDNDEIKAAADKGQDYFIGHFFNNGVLKDGMGNEQKAAIINHLFEWHIPTMTDDETGYLIIPGQLKRK